MSTVTVNLRYIVLGLLAQQPMSGYDIKRFFKGLSWLIGSPSPGSLYPILRQLLEQGLSTVKVVPSLDRPARKIYQVTEAGRQELQAWIERQGVSDASMKAFVMRLLLTDAFPHTKLVAQLEKRRAQVSAHRIALEANYPVLDRDSNSGQCMTLDYGLALATAELAWLDGTLARLTQRLPSEESG